MGSYKKKYFEFFCPLCCSLQRTRTITKLTWLNHIQMALATLCFTFLFWNLFGIKGLTSYLVIWGIFEIVYRLRKRKEFVCRNCGFDPFLYKADINKMRAEVKNFIQNRIFTDERFKGVKLKNYLTEKPEIAPAAAVNSAKTNSNSQGEGIDKLVLAMPAQSDAANKNTVSRSPIGGRPN